MIKLKFHLTRVWISTAAGNQSSDMDQKYVKLSKNTEENNKFEIIRKLIYTHTINLGYMKCIYWERAKSKYRSKCSCSLKNIARINREDISKRKHFKGEKGITDI